MEDIEKNVRVMDGNDDSIILRSNKMDMGFEISFKCFQE